MKSLNVNKGETYRRVSKPDGLLARIVNFLASGIDEQPAWLKAMLAAYLMIKVSLDVIVWIFQFISGH